MSIVLSIPDSTDDEAEQIRTPASKSTQSISAPGTTPEASSATSSAHSKTTPSGNNNSSDKKDKNSHSGSEKATDCANGTEASIPAKSGSDEAQPAQTTSTSSKEQTKLATAASSSQPEDAKGGKQSRASQRQSMPLLSFITLPGTPDEQEEIESTPKSSESNDLKGEKDETNETSGTGASPTLSKRSPGVHSTDVPIASPPTERSKTAPRQGISQRALPSRPRPTRADQRPGGTRTARGNLFAASGATSLLKDVEEEEVVSPRDGEHKVHWDDLPKSTKSSEFEDILVSKPASAPSSPRKNDSDAASSNPRASIDSPRSASASGGVPLDFDPSCPFGIADMAETPNTEKQPPGEGRATKPKRTLFAKPPAPPVPTDTPSTTTENRGQRSQSVSYTYSSAGHSYKINSEGKTSHAIPRPPTTTPAAVAPLVVPLIPVFIEGGHQVHQGHHISVDAERAKRENGKFSDDRRQTMPPGQVSPRMISPRSNARDDMDALAMSESHAVIVAPPPAFEYPSEGGDIPPPTRLSPRSVSMQLSQSTDETSIANRRGNHALHHTSSNPASLTSFEKEKVEKHEKPEKEKKEKKEKDKDKERDKKEEKEREKEKKYEKEEKDKEKEEKKGIFSLLSSKLIPRRKHDKSQDSSASNNDSELIEEESESESGPPDPLLAPQLSPAITPREGLMYRPPASTSNASISNTNASGNHSSHSSHHRRPRSGEGIQRTSTIAELEAALAQVTLPSSSRSSINMTTINEDGPDPEGGTSAAAAETEKNPEISELEAHKQILQAQIRTMEDLHRRLREAITEEQQTLHSAKKHGRSRSRSSGSSVSTSTPSSASNTPLTSPAVSKKHKGDGKAAETSNRKGSASGASLRPPTPVVIATANSSRTKEANLASMKLTENDIDSILGFKQKLGHSATKGDVYACRHFQTGLMVLVRVIPIKDALTNASGVLARAQTISKLEKERLAGVYHAQVLSTDLWLISHYCPIGSIGNLLETGALTISEDSARVIARSSLVALSYLHRSKFSHGSLNLSTILVDSGADVKLCDFALTYILGGEEVAKDFESQSKADLRALATCLVDMVEWDQKKRPSSTSLSSSEDADKPLTSLNGIPILKDASKFSSDFSSFINACCCTPTPASALLEHPFVATPLSNQPLIDAVASALATLRSQSAPEQLRAVLPTMTRQELDNKFNARPPSPAISKVHLHERTGSNASSSEGGNSLTLSSSPSATEISSNASKISTFKTKVDESIEKALSGASEETQRVVQLLRASIFAAAEDALPTSK